MAKGKRQGKCRMLRAWCYECHALLQHLTDKRRPYTHLICPRCDSRYEIAAVGDCSLVGALDSEAVQITGSK